MRITSGEARGRVLHSRQGSGTRPTDARSRETLFNLLATRVPDSNFLDLYAGSGAVGLEALSRGARHCVFVEANAGSAATVRTNVGELGWADRTLVWHGTVKAALANFARHAKRFDIIFADPPFTLRGELKQLCVLLDNYTELLHNEPVHAVDPPQKSLLVIQHHWKELPALASRFVAVGPRRSGESMFSFFEYNV